MDGLDGVIRCIFRGVSFAVKEAGSQGSLVGGMGQNGVWVGLRGSEWMRWEA